MGKQASKRSKAADTFTQTIIIIQLLCPTSDYLQSRVQGEREREMWMCVFKRSCMSRRKSKKCVCALPCATQLCNLWLEQIEIERESESVCLRVIVCVCREILCLSVWTEWSVRERTSAWEMEAISYFCGRLLVVVVVVVKQAWQAEVLTPILQAVISKSIHSPIRTVPLSLSLHTHSLTRIFQKVSPHMQKIYAAYLPKIFVSISFPNLLANFLKTKQCFGFRA